MIAIEPEVASIARTSVVLRAVGHDVAGWLAPWCVFGLLCLIPAVRSAAWIFILLLVLAMAVSVGTLVADIVRLKANGYTAGLMKYNLRVIDFEQDHLIYKARLDPKKVWKLLAGRYEIIDISPNQKAG